jgi:hypothetical protein
MHIKVEETGITRPATAAEAAATAVATIQLDAVVTSVALAMPGSRSAGEAARVDVAVADAARALAAALAEDAEALRTAVSCYAITENHVVGQGRRPTAAT